MWLHLFSVNTGGVRVPSLQNHMIQNNDFLKTYYPESYLPPHQRIKWYYRILRFLIVYPAMMLMVVSTLDNRSNDEAYQDCLYRDQCSSYCQADVFPDTTCQNMPNVSLKYNGNTYKKLYKYPAINTDEYRHCKDRLDNNPDYPWSDSDHRQWRVHTCFRSCKYPGEVDENFDDDTRDECEKLTDSYGEDYYEFDLWCVDPDDSCEKPEWWDESCSGGDLCLSFAVIWFSILIANFGQVLIECSLYYTLNITYKPTEIERKMNPVKNEQRFTLEEEPPCDKVLKKCFSELIIAFSSIVVVLALIVSMIAEYQYGRPGTVWVEWIIAMAIDQAKSLFIQPFLWWFVVRRCGRIPPSFGAWKDEQVMPGITDESYLNELRGIVARFLETKPAAFFMIGIVFFYAIFILCSLSLDTYYSSNQGAQDFFDYVDKILITYFMAEIVVRYIGSGVIYFLNLWNFIDFAVVLVSFVFMWMGQTITGIAVLRLLRLIRVIIVMRRVSESKKRLLKLRNQNQSVSSNVARAMDLLEEIINEKSLTRTTKQDVAWVLEHVKSRKLYTSSINQNQVDESSAEVKAWKNFILNDYEDFQGSHIVQGNKNLGDKILKRSRQSSVDAKMFETQKYVEKVNGVFTSPSMDREPLEPEKLTEIDETLEKINDWNWDLMKFASVTGELCFPILCLKLFLKYDVYKSFDDINHDKWLNYLSALYMGYTFQNPYHRPEHILDTVHATHYFYKTAGFETLLTTQDIMIGFVAAFIHDYEHPGLTNQFLIRTKHPKAIRYSDMSPLEEHHVAAAFKLMHSDNEFDIFDFVVDESNKRLIRKMIIYMVIHTDLAYHFEMVNGIQAKILSDQFPKDTVEDRLDIMTFALHCADICKPARSWFIYRMWIDNMMEEFFLQGKMEKELGIPVSAFMDEESTNKERVQLTYIDYVVKESLDILNIISPSPDYENVIQRDLIESLNLNRRNLQKKIDGEVKF